MTRSATRLVGTATFRALTGHAVATEMFDEAISHAIEHISLAELADLLLIAPATANMIAKLAAGIADDLLSCTALATTAPILVAPAMHTAMYEHPATQENLGRLRGRGVTVVGPGRGRLASGGYGIGRLAPVEEIFDTALALLGRDSDLAGHRIVVTAGGTREAWDPVRFLGNRSSGKMGVALAEAARDRGATVMLIAGAISIPTPYAISVVRVDTAAEMLAAVRDAVGGADALLMAAAVADLRPRERHAGKIKKVVAPDRLALETTEDILASVSGPRVRVGFAAESDALVEGAMEKLEGKHLDLVVANRIDEAGTVFGSEENEVILVRAERSPEPLPRMSKRQVAERILDHVAELLRGDGA
jgi:phosphopantothenoylcysteine decarboxylase/phosphopantothenate--cysteine ligase